MPFGPTSILVRYLTGELSLEAAAAEYEETWIAWHKAGELGPYPVLGRGLDPHTLGAAETAKLYALLERVTSFRIAYGINEGAREYLSSAGDSEFDQAVRRLADDVTATLGEGHVNAVWSFAAHARTVHINDPAYQREKCVEDVQQFFQDTFVDTTWPACPRHPNHPLDYTDGAWRCPRDKAAVAQLGELRSLGHDGSA